jgi:hypothetical protein
MKDILYFDSLITPKILTIVYWLALVVVVVGGLSMIFSGSVFTGLFGIIFGALGVRVSFEMIMIAFKNNEYLKKIAEK